MKNNSVEDDAEKHKVRYQVDTRRLGTCSDALINSLLRAGKCVRLSRKLMENCLSHIRSTHTSSALGLRYLNRLNFIKPECS